MAPLRLVRDIEHACEHGILPGFQERRRRIPLNRELQDNPGRFEQSRRFAFAVTVHVHPAGIGPLHVDYLDIGQGSRPPGKCSV